MVHQRAAEIREVRPGRRLFCRHVVLGQSDDRKLKKNSTSWNVICIHGTAASESQYLSFLDELERKLPSYVTVNCYLQDAVGCGQSPKLDDVAAYTDQEQIQDWKATIDDHVDTNLPTFWIAHSYGPMLLFKYLRTYQPSYVAGLILVSTGVRSKDLCDGGPGIFRVPLWILRCLQPLLTSAFLKKGFAPATHNTNPALIAAAKESNNGNDMQVVKNYYGAHQWLESVAEFATIAPSLVMHGIQDDLVSIAHGQEVANQLNTTLQAVTDASHMILLEQPLPMALHVLSFIQATVS